MHNLLAESYSNRNLLSHHQVRSRKHHLLTRHHYCLPSSTRHKAIVRSLLVYNKQYY
ncbi:hypothetical protein [Lyngbya aestuarii]|uniref:hypothetical protein n=1 Tax=Lyngbya aestuarii TaxID=118322 RepID=UPI00403E0AEA